VDDKEWKSVGRDADTVIQGAAVDSATGDRENCRFPMAM